MIYVPLTRLDLPPGTSVRALGIVKVKGSKVFLEIPEVGEVELTLRGKIGETVLDLLRRGFYVMEVFGVLLEGPRISVNHVKTDFDPGFKHIALTPKFMCDLALDSISRYLRVSRKEFTLLRELS